MSSQHDVPSHWHEFTSFGSPVDLYGYLSKNRPARAIKVVAGSGTITVRCAGNGANNEVLTVAAGEEISGYFISIQAVSSVTNIRVAW